MVWDICSATYSTGRGTKFARVEVRSIKAGFALYESCGEQVEKEQGIKWC
jgi:hypothetical protein